MNTIFTIVTKSYLGLANAVFTSIRKYDDQSRLVGVVVDNFDKVINCEDFPFDIIFASDLDIPNFESLAFKYNITEFCTSIKPYVFNELFNDEKTEKVIYIDPDLYFYDNLDSIWEKLDHYAAIVTPHFVTFYDSFVGYVPEHSILYSGLFNFGFFAVKKSSETLSFIHWWALKLHDLCYADKQDGLYVDQKWADYITIFLNESLFIDKSLGYNIAYWNIHEREFYVKGDALMVRNRITRQQEQKVVFAHFSGVDPSNIYINRQCATLDFNKYPDYLPVIKFYAARVIEDFNRFNHLKYSFSTFPDGTPILHFHRRLYRSIIEADPKLEEYYDIKNIYSLFKKSNLLLSDVVSPDKENESTISRIGRKLSMLITALKCIKMILGLKRYLLLIRFFNKYSRPERQNFLLTSRND